MILIQPATHVVKDEEAYRKSITEGLDLAVSRNSGIVFTICETGVENHEVETGIQVWPLGMLIERLRSASFHEARSYQEALSQNSTSLSRFPLGAIGWIDVSNWEAVHRLLEYVEKPWGYKRVWAPNEHYVGKVLSIKAREGLSLQYHKEKDETIRIESGQMGLRVGQSVEELETVVLDPGMSYAIPPWTHPPDGSDQ